MDAYWVISVYRQRNIFQQEQMYLLLTICSEGRYSSTSFVTNIATAGKCYHTTGALHPGKQPLPNRETRSEVRNMHLLRTLTSRTASPTIWPVYSKSN
jgi:hypothetical protein